MAPEARTYLGHDCHNHDCGMMQFKHLLSALAWRGIHESCPNNGSCMTGCQIQQRLQLWPDSMGPETSGGSQDCNCSCWPRLVLVQLRLSVCVDVCRWECLSKLPAQASGGVSWSQGHQQPQCHCYDVMNEWCLSDGPATAFTVCRADGS